MNDDSIFIHPTAIVHPQAQIEEGVWIGPYSFIGENVNIHSNTKIDANVYIDGWTEIGKNCHFSPFSSIGTHPQDITYKEEKVIVKIGERNIFREFVTVNRGTLKGGGETFIGNDNYFMAYSHVGHDCFVGSWTTFVNGATLSGHVRVEDYSTVGAFTGVHQFCRVGKYAFIGGYSVITQDVLPFSKVAGSRPPLLYGLNAVGLRRRRFSRERIQKLKEIFKIIFYSDLNTAQAVEKIKEEFDVNDDMKEILNFINSSKRGIIKKVSE